MNTVILRTYGSYNAKNDTTKELEFTIDKSILEQLLKKEGWGSVEEFLSEYTYDSSSLIYFAAKETNAIIEKKEVEPFKISDIDRMLFKF